MGGLKASLPSGDTSALPALTSDQQTMAIALVHHFIAQRMVTAQRKQRIRCSIEWCGSVPRSVTIAIIDPGRMISMEEILKQLPKRVGFRNVRDLVLGLRDMFGREAIQRTLRHMAAIPEARAVVAESLLVVQPRASIALQH